MTARRLPRPTRSAISLSAALLLASIPSFVPASSALAADAQSIEARNPASDRSATALRLQAAPMLLHPPVSPLVCRVSAPAERPARVSLSAVPWPAPATETSAAEGTVALATVPAAPGPDTLTVPDVRERPASPALDRRPWPRPDPVHAEWWRTAPVVVDAAVRWASCPTG